MFQDWWLMIDDKWLITDVWSLVIHDWRMMIDNWGGNDCKWWFDDWCFMTDWWLMACDWWWIDDCWLLIENWCLMLDDGDHDHGDDDGDVTMMMIIIMMMMMMMFHTLPGEVPRDRYYMLGLFVQQLWDRYRVSTPESPNHTLLANAEAGIHRLTLWILSRRISIFICGAKRVPLVPSIQILNWLWVSLSLSIHLVATFLPFLPQIRSAAQWRYWRRCWRSSVSVCQTPAFARYRARGHAFKMVIQPSSSVWSMVSRFLFRTGDTNLSMFEPDS